MRNKSVLQDEVIATERQYGSVLHMLKHAFQDKMEDAVCVSAEDSLTLFGDVESQ